MSSKSGRRLRIKTHHIVTMDIIATITKNSHKGESCDTYYHRMSSSIAGYYLLFSLEATGSCAEHIQSLHHSSLFF